MPDPTAEAATVLAEIARRWRDGDPGAVRSTRDLVDAAVAGLEAGLDSPSLRELAGAGPDEGRYVVEPLLVATLSELGLPERPVAGRTVGLDGLRAFVGLVARDARGDGLHLDVAVEGDPASWEHPHAAYLGFGDSRVSVHLGHDDVSPAEELERVADLVHGWLVEDLPARHRATNWPRCGLHPTTHPLVVSRDHDDVVWACPLTGRPQARVGELHPG